MSTEEELHETAHIDYDRVAIVCIVASPQYILVPNVPPKIPNPSVAALYEDALVYETGSAITSSGALTAYSGKKTGRSPLDKRIVKEPSSEDDIWYVHFVANSCCCVGREYATMTQRTILLTSDSQVGTRQQAHEPRGKLFFIDSTIVPGFVPLS